MEENRNRRLFQLETRLPDAVTLENSASGDSTCESVNALASCCSSNESNELAKENSDLEEEENEIHVEVETCSFDFLNGRERATTPLLSEVGEGNVMQKMPSETELEEFFAAAEKDLQKQFSDKYNFDILDDKPLEGRYEWVQLNAPLDCTYTGAGDAIRFHFLSFNSAVHPKKKKKKKRFCIINFW